MNEILAKLNSWLHRKEAEKFTVDGSGDTAVNVVGQLTPRGLFNGGQITKITLNDTAWVALERSATTAPTGAGPLSGRNSISLQNRTKKDILIQFDNTITDVSISLVIKGGGERFYDIEDTITVYARSATGAADIILEELG